MIVNIEKSKQLFKRYQVEMNNGKKYNFGLKNGSTYIDHHDKDKRENYRKRHYGNKIEKQLIDNLIPSPSLFSFYILWGNSTNINKNIETLNNMWRDKHNKE